MAEQAASPGCAPRTGLAMLTRWLPEHPRRTEEELMAGDPRIRASDEDRDRTVSLLREHHAAGRLTPEEFNDRIDKAYEAKTMGELDELMADLPAIDLYRLPGASPARSALSCSAAGSPGATPAAAADRAEARRLAGIHGGRARGALPDLAREFPGRMPG